MSELVILVIASNPHHNRFLVDFLVKNRFVTNLEFPNRGDWKQTKDAYGLVYSDPAVR